MYSPTLFFFFSLTPAHKKEKSTERKRKKGERKPLAHKVENQVRETGPSHPGARSGDYSHQGEYSTRAGLCIPVVLWG